jgi:hypothetical protein
MAVTKIKYSPSVNIIRDSNYSFRYIPTPNSNLAFTSLLNDIQTGVNSHILIGAFGSGKSSFLLSFKQTLERSYIHFKGHQKLLNSVPDYEFLSIVGEFSSFENHFAKLFSLGKGYTGADILKHLDKHYKSLKKKGKGLAILIDEFGKYLEYAAKNNPGSELYFVQLLAEWVNDSSNDTMLICTLHQDFSAYALQLDKLQRNEWDKVKGRLKTITFNEPVEQLLFLAAERIDEKFPKKTLDKNFDSLFNTIKEAKVFPLRDYFEKDFAKKLYPFDILSSAVLTLSLQQYGQNERSLFSFIESNDHLSINEFDTKTGLYYSIPRVYDYLLNNYYSFLTTKYNPHFNQWSGIRKMLEKIDGLFKDPVSQRNAADLIKLIGLLNIFAASSARMDPRFYADYARYALGIKNADEILKALDKKRIIRYVNHSLRYILSEGTDLDIELAIDDAGRLVEKVTNVVNHLNLYFEFPFISARAISYEKGTPRFFQFKLTEEPVKLIPEGEVDGFINLVFSDDPKVLKKVEECSAGCKEAVLYGCYRNTSEIRNILYKIQKVKKVIADNQDDKVALSLLNEELTINIKLLNHYVLDNLYADGGNIVWYFNGRKLKINNRQKFNQELSRICRETYTATPVYKSELINKTRVSGQIATARNRLLKKLLTELDKHNIGFTDNEFPPEKSIYLTLLRQTGIHKLNNGVGMLDEPDDVSFDELWEAGINFLESTRNKERNLNEFIQILSARPFKLKQGFIDYWVPVFLLAKRDDFALYAENVYVPEIEEDILELMNKKPGQFSVKAFDVVGIKLQLFNRYRVFLNQSENQKPTNRLFIQTIKPFLVFYRDLPEYSKKTTRLDKRTVALRNVIAGAKDPEKAFFEDFPGALGFRLSDLQKNQAQAEAFIKKLQDSIRELRTSYDALVDRFEKYFISEVIGSSQDFPAYRDELRTRFKEIKAHLLLTHQKPFYNRIQSELDDKKAWLSSIAQACIGKPLDNISDDDELLMYDRLCEMVYELDNLCEISRSDINDEKEEVLKLEITSLMKGLNKSLLRIPKEKAKEIEKKQQEIKRILGRDKKINLAVLGKLLQDILKNE